MLLLLACHSSDVDPKSPAADPETRIIVVGAGISGLTVAQALNQAGVEVIVLEARDRIGGRTWTTQVGNATVDMGAAWLHGTNNNPVADFADASGLSYVKDKTPWSHVYDQATGQSLTDPAWNLMDSTIEDFTRQLKNLRQTLGSEATVADGREKYLDDLGIMGQDRRFAAYAIDQWMVELEYAGPVDTMSLEEFWEEDALTGGDHFPVGGYTGYAEKLAEGLEIELSKPVTDIIATEDGVVVTAGGEAFEGTQVVVTVPVGVLKAGKITFDPPLSEERQDALARLEMGNLEKVILTWDSYWWEGGLTFVSADEDGAFPEFYDLTEYAGAPTMVGLYGGRFSRQVQADWSDEEIIEGALSTLRESFGPNIPEPAATAVTHWTTDPYSGGSYTFLPVGATREDVDMLAEPEGERVFFAGEGTYWTYYGNVHGAMLSGLREAHRLGVEKIKIPGLENW